MIFISAIIPVSPSDKKFPALLSKLEKIPVETILSISKQAEQKQIDEIKKWKSQTVIAPDGLSEQINAGANSAKGKYLWFLSTDSKAGLDNYLALEKSVKEFPNALHMQKQNFFLKIFKPDSINLCISKEMFEEIGCFPDNPKEFIKNALQKDVPIKSF